MSRRQQRKFQRVRGAESSLSRGWLAAVLISALIVAGCSSDGDGSGSTPSSKTSTSVTVVGPDGTSIDLQTLLPTAADLGPDYTVTTDDDDDDAFDLAFDEALNDACPAIARLSIDEPHQVERSYERSDGPTVAVAVAPGTNGWSEADLKESLDAFEGCDTFSFSHDGIDVTLNFSAQRSDDFGELGLRSRADMTLDADNLPEPVRVRTESLEFLIGGVGVSIAASDGVDYQTGAVMSGDFGLLDPLANHIGVLIGVDYTTTTVTQPTTAPPTTEPDFATTSPASEPPSTVAPTTTAATPLPGSQCTLRSHPDCIDPDGDGVGTFLLFGEDCMQSFADDAGVCTDLDGDGRAGYPDSG